MYPAYLLPDILTCRAFYEDRINFFGLVDYRTNHSTVFSVDVNVDNVTFLGEVYDTLARFKDTSSPNQRVKTRSLKLSIHREHGDRQK